jgi:hypothetical protein
MCIRQIVDKTTTKESKQMVIKTNKNNRTFFVYDKNSGVETFISTPFAGAKKATTLTIRDGDYRLDLNGRQVRTLRAVLDKAAELSA